MSGTSRQIAAIDLQTQGIQLNVGGVLATSSASLVINSPSVGVALAITGNGTLITSGNVGGNLVYSGGSADVKSSPTFAGTVTATAFSGPLVTPLAATSLYGNPTGASASPSAIAIGTGLTIVNGNTLNATASFVGGPGISINTGTISATETVSATTTSPYTLAAASTDQGALVGQNVTGLGGGTIVLASALPVGFYADVMNSSATGNTYLSTTTGTLYQAGLALTGSVGARAFTLANHQVARVLANGSNYQVAPYSPFTQTPGPGGTGNPVLSYNGSLLIGSGGSVAGSTALSIGNTNTVGSQGLVVGTANVAPLSLYSAAIGNAMTMTSSCSVGSGSGGLDFGTNNSRVLANYGIAASRGVLKQEYLMGAVGSGSATVRMITDNTASPGPRNTGVIASGWNLAFSAVAVVKDSTFGGYQVWVGANQTGVNLGMIMQSGAAATNTIAAGFSFVSQGTFGTYTIGGTLGLAADTTNGGFNATFTSDATTTANFLATLEIVTRAVH